MSLSLDRQNRYREQYRAAHPGWQPATEVYAQRIRALLRPETRLIDLGCGRGGVLEQVGAGVAYPVGLDPDLASLREHRIADLPRAQALAEALPLQAGCADVLVCSWVFEHLPAPARTLAEIARVLRPNGAAVFITPNRGGLPTLAARLLRPLQKRLVPLLFGRAEADTFPAYYRANSRPQLVRLTAQAGLYIDELRAIPDPTYFAFTPLLYRISAALGRVTPPVHLVGVLRKL